MAETVISMRGIGKKYRLQEKRFVTKDLLKLVLGRFVRGRDFWALQDINLDVQKGESVGILGENGSGKSTLLKILSHITDPTIGSMTINGQISSLLELGAGFHPYLSGRENIYLNGVILGMSRKFIDQQFKSIVDFSGIEKFIDTPVQNYSSGMYIRLGFAIAVHMNPDILVLDEVLSVGDEEFQRKSKDKILEIKDQGKTILFVSHDLNAVRDICDRIYWLKDGRIHDQGEKELITSRYLTYVGARMGLTTLSWGSLSLIFERGKLILFWKGIELTKNCCGYTEIVLNGVAYGSMQAQWVVSQFSKKKFSGIGQWNIAPVKQYWEVEIVSDKEIKWTLEMHMTNEISINYDSVILMLSDRYTHWITSSETGTFPETFHNEFGQRLIGVGQSEKSMGVQSVQLSEIQLPGITFKIIESGDSFFSQVTNTEKRVQSRTLQFSRIVDADTYSRNTVFKWQCCITLNEESSGDISQ